MKNPHSALITDSSEVVETMHNDQFRTSVLINEDIKVGVHKAVEGDHDFPNPEDLLCAALASCFESSLRIISNKLSIKLIETKIKATALIDVRGTLMIHTSLPIRFQSIYVEALIKIKDSTEQKSKILIKGVERNCIVYQALKQGTPIILDFNFE